MVLSGGLTLAISGLHTAVARSGVDGSRCIYVCGMTVCRGLGPRPAVPAILLNFYPLSFYPTTPPCLSANRPGRVLLEQERVM